MEIRRLPRRVGLEPRQGADQRIEEGQGEGAADGAGDEVSHREPAIGRIVRAGAFEQRVEGAAEIGAKHQRQRSDRRYHLGAGQRHDQQHNGDARMRRPGEGKDHQPEPHHHPAEIACACPAAALEGGDAGDEEQRRQPADVEGQQLNDQRAADIGAEHDRQRRAQIDHPARREGRHHQSGGGAALEHGGHAQAGDKGLPAAAQPGTEHPPQIPAIGAQDAALHHVHAPEQQRHAAHEVEENETARRSALGWR